MGFFPVNPRDPGCTRPQPIPAGFLGIFPPNPQTLRHPRPRLIPLEIFGELQGIPENPCIFII